MLIGPLRVGAGSTDIRCRSLSPLLDVVTERYLGGPGRSFKNVFHFVGKCLEGTGGRLVARMRLRETVLTSERFWSSCLHLGCCRRVLRCRRLLSVSIMSTPVSFGFALLRLFLGCRHLRRFAGEVAL